MLTARIAASSEASAADAEADVEIARPLMPSWVVLMVAIVNEIVWRTQTDDVWVAFRGGLWIASAAFGIWQVFFIMKHMIKDEDQAVEPASPDPGL